MHCLKTSLLTFVLVALVVMVSAFSVTYLSTITYKYNQTFILGTAYSDPLDDVSKWDVVPSLPGCIGSIKLSSIVVTNLPGQAMPPEQTIINHIRAQYDANGDTFNYNEVVDIFVNSIKVAEAIVKLHN